MAEKEKEKEEAKITDLPGIGPAVAAKLEAAGIYDMMGLAVSSPSELAELAGVGEAVARKAIQAARKLATLDFQDGMEFAKSRENLLRITTGSKNLDNLLGGRGIETKAMTEAYGAFGSGKCVSKDCMVSYFNDESLHLQTIEEAYEKYKTDESPFEDGFVIPTDKIKVLAFNGKTMEVMKASHLYKEKVEKLFLITTRRGRILKVTGNHQLLGFENGFSWKKVFSLKKGDAISYPKEINVHDEFSELDENDAYFIGFFVAEGTANPFSVCNCDKGVIDWIFSYVKEKFGYAPTIKVKDGKNRCYNVLLRNSTRKIMEGLDKTNSSTKFVPEKILNSNKKIISSFIAGYLDGDGDLSKNIASSTTKSSRLASQLSYLFLRLGISATMSKKIAIGEEFFVISVVGEDRKKLNNLPFKLKKIDYSGINSSYGTPKQIIKHFRKIYKETIGGNRGKHRKIIGKKNSDSQAYRHLTKDSFVLNMNSKTLFSINEIFLNGKKIMENILEELNGELTREKLKRIFNISPFAFNSISGKMSLKKKSIANYITRKLPENKKDSLKKILTEEIIIRKEKIDGVLSIISELDYFNWDWIEKIDEVDYNDYVYDFVVPDGHSFVGGNMPTIMHNSQLGFCLVVNVQLPIEKGGANGKAVFIDCEGTFRPERIKQISEGIGANAEKVLKNIFVARAFNSDHQILLLDKIGEMIKNGEPIKLLVIDSLTAHFRAEFSGRGQLADRQQKLNRYLHSLLRLAEQHNIAIYVTNQVMANPGMMFGDPTTPIGGHILAHACLTGDSLIQLADGSIKNIKEMSRESIVSGDLKTLEIKETNSEQVFVNPNIQEIYEIKTNNQIKCSPLHRFFTIENFNVVEKEAKELTKENFVLQNQRINILGEEQKLPIVHIKRIGKISEEDRKKIRKELEKAKITREEICRKIGITKRHFRRVLNQGLPSSINVLHNLQTFFSGKLQLQYLPVQTYKHRNLIMPEIMNSQLGQLLGYFLGDGNFESGCLRFRDERIEILQNYNSLFKQVFNIDGSISKINGKNCFNLNINSVEIKKLFEQVFLNIFDYIGKSKGEAVKAFIKGFVDAEGHIDKKRPIITIVQKEKEILRYLQLFLLRFGIKSTIKFCIGKKKMNVLRIIGKDVLDYMQIGFTALDKQKQLLKYFREYTFTKNITPIKRAELWALLKEAKLFPSKFIKPRKKDECKFVNFNELEESFKALMATKVEDRQIKEKINFIFKILNSDMFFEKIREIKITKNENKELFYDFSVPETENYFANGFAVHNSTTRIYLRRGKKDSRVAKLIDSPNLPDNETIFFITKDGVKDGEVAEE